MGPAIYTIVIYVMLDEFLKLLVVLLVIDHLSRMRAHMYFNIDLSSAYLTLVEVKTCSGGMCVL